MPTYSHKKFYLHEHEKHLENITDNFSSFQQNNIFELRNCIKLSPIVLNLVRNNVLKVLNVIHVWGVRWLLHYMDVMFQGINFSVSCWMQRVLSCQIWLSAIAKCSPNHKRSSTTMSLHKNKHCSVIIPILSTEVRAIQIPLYFVTSDKILSFCIPELRMSTRHCKRNYSLFFFFNAFKGGFFWNLV